MESETLLNLEQATEQTLEQKLPKMNITEIASVIRKDWKDKINFAAKPYLQAMQSMDSVNDQYGMDSGRSIVAYFLCNAGTWRGNIAKSVKKELNKRIK